MRNADQAHEDAGAGAGGPAAPVQADAQHGQCRGDGQHDEAEEDVAADVGKSGVRPPQVRQPVEDDPRLTTT